MRTNALPVCGGLTLAELLASLAILSVLAAAGWPAYTGLLARQTVDQAVDRLAASLALARSMAMARRVDVALQPLDGRQDLDQGWQVVAASEAGAAGAAATVLSVVEPAAPCLRVALRQTARGSHAVRFTAVGYSRSEQGGFQAATFSLSCRGAQRQVRLGAQGRIRLCTPERDSDCDAADGPEPP
ncbi:GspH/FimT family pseudopilin [Cupriavidus necator]|uniref:GspH/FimT family pseudopilin n=1 Tax=Cupriavidus necator TaxID=106590 RepID=UPI0005B4E4E6|nr:GspH/FimT family pseudopilin [Cupriavidus necator]